LPPLNSILFSQHVISDRAMINAGKESTVPSHFSSKGEDSRSYVAAPDLVDRFDGASPANGSRMIDLADAGVRSAATAVARAVSATASSPLSSMFLQLRALEDLVDALMVSIRGVRGREVSFFVFLSFEYVDLKS